MLMTALQTKAKKLPEKPAVEQKGFKAFLKKNIYIIIAFFLPFVLMTIGFAIMEVSPFGDKQILVTDLWHQYYPFLVDFQDKLKHGESLFWSWTQGGGVNYFSLMSYYLAGPMNFLCVFIPSQWLREFLMFSVWCKGCLCRLLYCDFPALGFQKERFFSRCVRYNFFVLRILYGLLLEHNMA